MNLKHESTDKVEAPAPTDGFEVLDACHRQMLVTLGQLSALVTSLDGPGPDAQTRAMAAEVVHFFSTTARQHHEDEELHVFPTMLAGSDPEVVQAVLRLQQDHRWLEQDWLEISPLLDAVAAGQSWYDLAALREGVEIFLALSHEHIELEESLIYPQARAQVRADERREMGREMSARRRAEREAKENQAAPKLRS